MTPRTPHGARPDPPHRARPDPRTTHGLTPHKRRFAQGLAWTAASQVVEAIASFGAMLLLVRMISPEEYGRAASATGVLLFLNLASSRAFIDYALQLPDGEEPDWTRLWTLAWSLQSALFLVTNGVAFALALTPALAPVAPLLHIASFGMLVEGPAYLGATMTRRELDIRRLRVLLGLAVLLKLTGTIVLAAAGFGAIALVLGATVLTTVPTAADLLLVRRWRPEPGWWRAFDLAGNRTILRFGAQRMASGLVGGGRSLIEGLVLPATIGYEAVGLLGRAQALFTVTIGRITGAVTDTAYPFIARAGADRQRLARWTGGLVFGLLLLAVPGAFFLMLHGTLVTAVIFGPRWLPLTPYIVPAIAAALGSMLATTGATVLLASGRLRDALALEIVCIATATAATLCTLGVPSTTVYVWILGAGSLTTGVGALAWLARRIPSQPAILGMIAPVVAASLAGGAVSIALILAVASLSAPVQLLVTAFGFLVAGTAALLIGFRPWLHAIEDLLRSLRRQRADDALTADVSAGGVGLIDPSVERGALMAPESTPAKSI